MFISKHCNICLKAKKALFNVYELDVDNVSYSTKLCSLVPEVQWNYHHLICFICREQLSASYTFRELCLKSFSAEVKSDETALPQVAAPAKLETKNDNIIEFIDETSDVAVTSEGNLPNCGFDQEDDLPLAALKCEANVANDNNDNKVELLETELVVNDISDSEFDFPEPSYDDVVVVEKKVPCPECGKLFKSAATLKSHSMSMHTDKSEWLNDCYVCEKVFARKSTLVTHIKNKHLEKGAFECVHCLQKFQLKHLLVFHMKDYHMKNEEGKLKSVRTFECNVCNRIFSLRNALYDHAKREHGMERKEVRPYKCDVCDKRFKVSTYLISHKLYHEGKRTNMCNICGKGFITLKDLKIHETYHSNIFTYCCPECGQVFKNHKLLYAHKVSKHVAPEDWKFVCHICQKRFPRVSGYKMHLRRHLGDKRFLCHLCDKRFVSKFQLLRHVESHSNVKKFHCELCGKDYREKRILNIHLFDVHGVGESSGEKKLCHICSMSFSCNYKLRRHILKHNKPYGCMMCEKRYPDNYHLKQHLLKKHKVEDLKAFEITSRSLDITVKNESIETDSIRDDKSISSL